MSTILDTIADATRIRVAEARTAVPLEALKERTQGMPWKQDTFLKALAKRGLRFICEVKKASPSKGIIAEDFPYLDIARSYQEAGADAVSCLTEPQWFMGSDQIFCDIRQTIGTPMIRKDFTVDEYQIYEARAMGADAVLLICSLMDEVTLGRYLELALDLGMDALVETHNEDEIRMARNVDARIIGVNNRNLKDFTVDFDNARRLRELVPADCVYVAESGVKGVEDVALLASLDADAALIGEALMRADDKVATLAAFRAAAEAVR